MHTSKYIRQIGAELTKTHPTARVAFQQMIRPLLDLIPERRIYFATSFKPKGQIRGVRFLNRSPKVLIHLKGDMQVFTGTQKHRLRCGDTILVPPSLTYVECPGKKPPVNLMVFGNEDSLYAHVASWDEQLKDSRYFHVTSKTDQALHLCHMMHLLCGRHQEHFPMQQELLCAFLQLLPECLDDVSAPKRGYPLWVQTAETYIQEHLSNPDLSVIDLARMLGMDRSNFSRAFRRYLGTSPQQYIQLQRLQAAQHGLLHSRQNIREVAESVGYRDAAHFSRMFLKHVGNSPKDYRKLEGEATDVPLEANR